jgi:suppressor of G2 allele of SKP1
MERVGIVGFLRSIGRSCLSRRRRDSRNERDGLPLLPIPRTTYQETLLAPTDIAMNSATKGDEASAISNYPLAIEHYTNALTEMPRAPSYYISRSTAYSRLKPADGGPNFEAALNDAEVALRLAVDRGNRELMIAAQMRRAIALYQLGRLGDASYLFEILEAKVGSTKPSDDKNKEFQAAMAQGEPASKSKYRTELPIWLAKTRRQKPEKPEGDEKWAVTVKEIPDDVEIFSVAQLKDQLAAVKAENTQASARSEETTAVPPQKETPATLVNPDNYRHDWYQKNDTVFVTLHVKNLTDHVFSVKFTETSVSTPSGLVWAQR